jgi:hypothetical protein
MSDTTVEPPTTPDAEAPVPAGYDDGQDHIGLPHHTTTGLSNTKLAMWLFLGSECLLFGGLIRRTCCTATGRAAPSAPTNCGTSPSRRRRASCC